MRSRSLRLLKVSLTLKKEKVRCTTSGFNCFTTRYGARLLYVATGATGTAWATGTAERRNDCWGGNRTRYLYTATSATGTAWATGTAGRRSACWRDSSACCLCYHYAKHTQDEKCCKEHFYSVFHVFTS